MIKNYFKIAWRNFRKDRQFTFLNLMGLSTGLACTFLIYLWVNDELNVDKFHEKDSQLFQVLANHKEADNYIRTIVETPAPLAEAMAKEIPEIEYAVSSYSTQYGGNTTLSGAGKNIKTSGLYATRDYFNVFSYHLIHGDKNKVLSNKNSIVLSKDLTMKLFNTTENVLGKTIEWQHEKQFIVSGIFENPPANSSVQFDFLVSMEILLEVSPHLKEWGNSDPSTYIVLKENTNTAQFNQKFSDFIKRKIEGSNTSLFIRPYSDGYLYAKYENGVQSGGRIAYVKMFSIIAIFILIIACINFMNLSTAKASRRLKEIGIKKCVGASRKTLVFQYMGESMLMTFFSMIFAILLVFLLLPAFNEITGKQLGFNFTLTHYLALLGITLITGLVAGSYPALYLSGFNPVAVLKGKLKTSVGELWVRKGLVIFQFSLSVIFIIAVLVVYRQVTFIQTRNMGYNKDNIISIEMEGSLTEVERIIKNTQTYLSEVKTTPGILNASSMDHASIVNDFGSTSGLEWEGKDPKEVINFGNIGVNYGLMETMGIQMAEGRSFSRQLSSDSTEIIFNEAAIKAMGIKNPVGKIVRMWGVDRKIVGIARNFHFESVHENIKPFAIRLEPLLTHRIIAKIKAGTEKETLDRLQKLYKGINPGFSFNYKFMDQDYQALYAGEKRVATLSKYFAGLAIIISCLGLFGLAAFTAQRRQKEIGIRKVVGASVSNIAAMLSKDFLKLVLIAILIAFPLAWWAMNQWLRDFAYRIDIGADVFAIAGVAMLFITLLTISFQAIKAAIANPVKSLRTE